MANGNRGFARGVTAGEGQNAVSNLPPRTGVLHGRGNRLAELAAGQAVSREQELVDPKHCRIWEAHNRDYAALSEGTCADLIESFKAHGRQEVAAVVRRVRDAPPYQFEVICGARRHWTTIWMRDHGYPSFKFLVEPRELTDEEAFRIADLENRSRRDLTDIERARDYARAVERYYGGSQGRMAERLDVSQSWLSRYLELARLPNEVIEAFGSAHIIRITHGASLAPLLKNPKTGRTVLDEARRLAKEQADNRESGMAPVSAAAIVRRLQHAVRPTRSRASTLHPLEHIVRSSSGAVIARGERAGRRGGLAISLSGVAVHDRAVVLDAVAELLDMLAPRASINR